MELKHRLTVRQAAHDLDFPQRVAHGVPHGLTEPILMGFCLIYNPQSLLNRHLEPALHAGDRAALEDIVGRGPDAGQPGQQLAQHSPTVVHAPQQNRLVAYLYPPLQHTAHGPLRLFRQLTGVVELSDQVQRFLFRVLCEQVQELAVAIDAFRQRHRHAGAEADEIQMLYGRQFPEVPLNDVVGVHKGIAAGDQDIGNLLVLLDIGCGIVHPFVQLLLGQPHHPLAEAVTAVHSALVRAQQQHSLGVFVLQAVQFGVCRLAAGVEGTAGIKLAVGWDAHAPNGVIGVRLVHKREVIGGNHHGKTLDDLLILFGFLLRPAQHRRELLR